MADWAIYLDFSALQNCAMFYPCDHCYETICRCDCGNKLGRKCVCRGDDEGPSKVNSVAFYETEVCCKERLNRLKARWEARFGLRFAWLHMAVLLSLGPRFAEIPTPETDGELRGVVPPSFTAAQEAAARLLVALFLRNAEKMCVVGAHVDGCDGNGGDDEIDDVDVTPVRYLSEYGGIVARML